MAAPKPRNRNRRPRGKKGRRLWLESIIFCFATLGCWGYTAYALFMSLSGRAHVHVYSLLLFIDFVLPIYAIGIVISCRQASKAKK
jgi:hypothetical protein